MKFLQRDKIMGGRAHFRGGAAQRTSGIQYFVGIVDPAADLAVIAVLLLGFASRARAGHEAVGEKDALLCIEELSDFFFLYAPGFSQSGPYFGDECSVRFGVGAAVVVELNAEVGEVALMGRTHFFHQGIGSPALILGPDHGGGAMGVVAAEIANPISAHPLEADPDIPLDIPNEVADVEVAIHVGQSIRNQEFPRRRHGRRE